MTIPLSQIFTISFIYLTFLFGSAYATEKQWLPSAFTQHRLVRILALGVFAGAIAFYGALGLAAQFGASYLLYFFGASAAFLAAPLLTNRIGRIALAHKLGSLADFFAYRYPAPWVGGLITLLMLIGILPLIALQIHAVSQTINLLNQEITTDSIAIIFCITMIIFAILFGARHVSTKDKHEGLIVALALESVFKLIALITLAMYAIYDVFGGVEALSNWLDVNHMWSGSQNLPVGPSRSMLLMFFAFAVAAPHLFHILLTENDDKTLLTASRWGFPLYLLLFSLCLPPILWAAQKLNITNPPEFHAISLGLYTSNIHLTLLAFIGGFAAASGVLIVVTLALASMSINHIVLPLYTPRSQIDFLRFVLNARRVFIAGIILGAYALHRLFLNEQSLLSLGIVSFVAILQFLPALLGAFFWRRANSKGLLAGLSAGFTVWMIMLFLPMISDIVSSVRFDTPQIFEPSQQVWHLTTIISLSLNCFCFLLFSRFTTATQGESKAAEECMSSYPIQPYQGELVAHTVTEMENNLSIVLGKTSARQEISNALEELSLDCDEKRTYALIRIRNKIESNLTTTVGQTIAYIVVSRFLPLNTPSDHCGVIESIHSMEHRFEGHQTELTGLAAELNNLRHYHRQMLLDLPTAVCSVSQSGKIVIWNRAMESLTDINANEVVDGPLSELNIEWRELLENFIFNHSLDRLKVEFNVRQSAKLLYLHKSVVENTEENNNTTTEDKTGDIVVVIEDISDEQVLEKQLMHNQRLASIGQLAAGVAHEIGNPVTGIACLAQNIKIDSNQPELHEISNDILEQTNRISAILKSLVSFAHSGETNINSKYLPVSMYQCVAEAIHLLNLAVDQKDINYVNNCTPDLIVYGDVQRLLQIFVNILSNARDASKANSSVLITGTIIGNQIEIDVTDRGSGIPIEDLQKVFDAFYTTKDPGQGTGLGLAIVMSIIEEHYGSIEALKVPTGGTCVRIRLPLYEPN